MCGADQSLGLAFADARGSPPRVRSRQVHVTRAIPCDGITSACAEQTSQANSSGTASRDHLRVCGADLVRPTPHDRNWGSPPRVRSRLEYFAGVNEVHGITSACAEQTTLSVMELVEKRDHLRVCGADTIPMHDTYDNVGSPPRVRSRHRDHVVHDSVIGITSACAEQTR